MNSQFITALKRLETPANKTYLEAVAAMYNTIFEAADGQAPSPVKPSVKTFELSGDTSSIPQETVSLVNDLLELCEPVLNGYLQLKQYAPMATNLMLHSSNDNVNFFVNANQDHLDEGFKVSSKNATDDPTVIQALYLAASKINTSILGDVLNEFVDIVDNFNMDPILKNAHRFDINTIYKLTGVSSDDNESSEILNNISQSKDALDNAAHARAEKMQIAEALNKELEQAAKTGADTTKLQAQKSEAWAEVSVYTDNYRRIEAAYNNALDALSKSMTQFDTWFTTALNDMKNTINNFIDELTDWVNTNEKNIIKAQTDLGSRQVNIVAANTDDEKSGVFQFRENDESVIQDDIARDSRVTEYNTATAKASRLRDGEAFQNEWDAAIKSDASIVLQVPCNYARATVNASGIDVGLMETTIQKLKTVCLARLKKAIENHPGLGLEAFIDENATYEDTSILSSSKFLINEVTTQDGDTTVPTGIITFTLNDSEGMTEQQASQLNEIINVLVAGLTSQKNCVRIHMNPKFKISEDAGADKMGSANVTDRLQNVYDPELDPDNNLYAYVELPSSNMASTVADFMRDTVHTFAIQNFVTKGHSNDFTVTTVGPKKKTEAHPERAKNIVRISYNGVIGKNITPETSTHLALLITATVRAAQDFAADNSSYVQGVKYSEAVENLINLDKKAPGRSRYINKLINPEQLSLHGLNIAPNQRRYTAFKNARSTAGENFGIVTATSSGEHFLPYNIKLDLNGDNNLYSIEDVLKVNPASKEALDKKVAGMTDETEAKDAMIDFEIRAAMAKAITDYLRRTPADQVKKDITETDDSAAFRTKITMKTSAILSANDTLKKLAQSELDEENSFVPGTKTEEPEGGEAPMVNDAYDADMEDDFESINMSGSGLFEANEPDAVMINKQDAAFIDRTSDLIARVFIDTETYPIIKFMNKLLEADSEGNMRERADSYEDNIDYIGQMARKREGMVSDMNEKNAATNGLKLQRPTTGTAGTRLFGRFADTKTVPASQNTDTKAPSSLMTKLMRKK